jgi:hypothetical protein
MKRSLFWRRKLFFGCMLIAGGTLCGALLLVSNHSKLEMSLARVVDVRDTNLLASLDWRFPIDDTNADWVVMMKVKNRSGHTVWFGHEKVQSKVKGRWLETEDVAWLNSQYYGARVAPHSQEDLVVAVVPQDAEAVRLIVEYMPESTLTEMHFRTHSWAYDLQYEHKKLAAGLLLLDSKMIHPFRTRQFSRDWPKKTLEFSLPSPSPSSTDPAF